MDKLNSLQSAVLNLTKKYTKRQDVVLQALNDLRPDIVMRKMNTHSPKEIAEATQKYYRTYPVGVWGDGEWDFFIHGHGCRLTHKQTGERIEWDVGNLNTFDKTWFVNHLKWLLTQDGTDKDIQIVNSRFQPTGKTSEELKEIIFPILLQLSEEGFLDQSRSGTHYTITTPSAPSFL